MKAKTNYEFHQWTKKTQKKQNNYCVSTAVIDIREYDCTSALKLKLFFQNVNLLELSSCIGIYVF